LHPHEFIDDDAVFEQLDGGQAADTELGGNFLLSIGIDFDNQKAALKLVGELFEYGCERPARTAPLGPEIHQHRHSMRPIEDHGLEGGRVCVENVRRFTHQGKVRTMQAPAEASRF